MTWKTLVQSGDSQLAAFTSSIPSSHYWNSAAKCPNWIQTYLITGMTIICLQRVSHSHFQKRWSCFLRHSLTTIQKIGRLNWGLKSSKISHPCIKQHILSLEALSMQCVLFKLEICTFIKPHISLTGLGSDWNLEVNVYVIHSSSHKAWEEVPVFPYTPLLIKGKINEY